MKHWILVCSPWSFVATLVPFALAAGVGVRIGGGHWGHWALGLFAGVLFQATTNLLNVWGDESSGVDGVPGAVRTTPQVHDGLVSLRTVLTAAIACASIAVVTGLALCFHRADGVWRFNAPLLVAGMIGFLGATNYTTLARFKYHGLGVPFVSFLMGPLEIFVAFSLLHPAPAREALSALADPAFALAALLLVLPPAALVGGVMHGNDMRDIPTDRAAGIVTLASRLGRKGALLYYLACHTLPHCVALCWAALILRCGNGATFAWALLPLLAMPLSIGTMRDAVREYRNDPQRPAWLALERDSGRVHLVFGLLYALSFALSDAL